MVGRLNNLKGVLTMPYTYLIGWSNLNKFYYGVRYSINCNPSDLWKTYFTSSKKVAFFRKQHGEPDVIQVRKVFEKVDKAIIWEKKVLKRLNVLNEERWLNANIAGAFSPIKPNGHQKGPKNSMFGKRRPDLSERNKKGHSEKSKKKMSVSRTGRIWVTKDNKSTHISKEELNKFLEKGWVRGRVSPSKDQREKISQSLKGRPSPNKGKKFKI
jgi:hypothetical protein